MNLVLTTVAISASVLGSGMAFPQALRLFRTGRTAGVSPTWIGVSLAINGWWAAYATATALWVLLPVSVVSFGLYGWIAVVYLRVSGRTRVPPMFVGFLGLGMVPLPVVIASGWEVAGIVIGLCYGVQLAPAMVAAYRTRDLIGVSSGTWILSFAEALLWFAFGLGVGDGALVVGGVVGLLIAGAILVRLAVTGYRPFAIRPRRLAVAG